MSPPRTPLILLVHGAFHGAWCWAAVQAELDRRGIASLALDLPGHGASVEPLTDLHGDAARVRALIDAIDGPVVVVAHSYGGAVATQAAATASNVAHLVYLTAFVPDEGESVLDLTRSLPPADYLLPAAMVIGDDGTATVDSALARAVFYGECEPAVVDANVARLDPHGLASFAQPATVAGWKTIESTYVRCTLDEAIPIVHQDVIAARCTTVETLATDHSPFASRPAETADILERVVTNVSAKGIAG